MRSSRTTRFILASLVVGLGGCSDGTGPADLTSRLSFRYSGELTGSFEATGRRPSPDVGRVPYVVAFRTAVGELQLRAYQPHEAQGGDLTVINLGPVTYADSYLLPPPPQPGALSYQGGLAVFGIVGDYAGGSLYRLVSGTMEITQLTPTRVAGRFAGSYGVTDYRDPPEIRLTLDDGAFDAAIGAPDIPTLCQ
jgi:hypothetical protein